MSKTTNKFSLEVRAQAVWMFFDHQGKYSSRWAAAPSPLDRVNRQFKAPALNRFWVSDFTYVAIA